MHACGKAWQTYARFEIKQKIKNKIKRRKEMQNLKHDFEF